MVSPLPLTFSDTNQVRPWGEDFQVSSGLIPPSPVSQVCGEFRNSLPLELGEAFKCHRHDLYVIKGFDEVPPPGAIDCLTKFLLSGMGILDLP